MLDLASIDLEMVVVGLDDHSDFGSWWIDARTGEVWLWQVDDADPAFDPAERDDARPIEMLPSRVGYEDMEDFISQVPDRRAADLLSRALAGRGAFRRFKDTLVEFPDLRERWSEFSDTRMQRRAVQFLVDEALVDDAQAHRALVELEDRPITANAGTLDPVDVARAVAADLNRLYGDRLVDVVLYGSQARGDARPDSDVDVAVILNEVPTPWEELRRMDDILWQHSLEAGLTISATPISGTAWQERTRPFVQAVAVEAIPLR